jgi:hypothetical protein
LGDALLCVAIDAVRHRRLHPVFAICALTVVGAFQLSYYAVQTQVWMKMVAGLFG